MRPTLRQEKNLWRKGFKFVVGLDEAGRGCERPDAEVLTNNGWKFYTEIDPSKDKVLSYTNDGYLKWQKIEKIIEKDFEGNLIELKNRGIHIIVTPDHYFTVLRRVFKRDKKDNNRLKLIGYVVRKERKKVTDLLNNDFIPRGGKWKGINKKFFKLPKVNGSREKLIDIKLWVAFLGLFLAEGSTSYYKKKGMYRVTISQDKNTSPKKYKKIASLLEKLPFKFNKSKIGFTCCNKQLYTYLKQFGNCYQKFIPKDIKELPPHLLNILINWMILGDGTCYKGPNRKKVCIYYTASERLKDDFEEVLLKAGWTYHTSVRRLRKRYIKGRIIKKETQVPCFEIRLRRNNKVQVRSLHKKELFYKGKVFCLQLPKYHNFYVRRNGTGYFTGNSLAGPVIAGAVMIKPGANIRKLKKEFKNLRDSKKLTKKEREKFFKILKKSKLIDWGIGIVSEKIIDKINIFEATKLAMKKAIFNLNCKLQMANDRLRKGRLHMADGRLKNGRWQMANGRSKKRKWKIDYLILDGNLKLDLPVPQKAIVKADEKVFSCALASILAKVKRDKIMEKYTKKYPEYHFEKHKGYGTKEHLKLLKKFGPCKIHRKSFLPVKALLLQK